MDWAKTQISLDLIISDVGGFIDQRQQKKLFKRKCSFDRSIFFSGMRKNMNTNMEFKPRNDQKLNLFSPLDIRIVENTIYYISSWFDS